MGTFSIDAKDFEWIDGSRDDPEDLCLHGHATAIIGNQKLEYWVTVSATALYLLKSLTENHLIDEDIIQMMPCCGHFMIPNKDLSEVVISGCGHGIDWSVIHEDDDTVKIRLEDGTEEKIAMADYKAEVFRFADKIEAYYQSCSPKIIPEDQFERDGYTAFWNEWHRRRGM